MNTKIFKPSKHKLAKAVALGIVALAATKAHAIDYTFNDLGSVSGPYASYGANGINNLGQVTGFVQTGPGSNDLSAATWTGNNITLLNNLPGAIMSLGTAINDAGQTAGYNYYGAAADLYHGIRWDGTTPVQLGDLGGGYQTSGNSINNSGQIAGTSWNGTARHAVSWEGAAITDLGTLGGTQSYGQGLNDSGQVVGYAFTTNNDAIHAAAWSGGITTDLGTLGGTSSFAWGVNNAGQIVGDSYTAGDSNDTPTLWNSAGSAPVDLGALHEFGGFAQAINNAGQIVGVSYLADYSGVATLWQNGSIIDLNSLLPAETHAAGWSLNFAAAINDHGAITGSMANSITHSSGIFTLTPTAVPLPAGVWLFGSALAGFVGLKRRKQVATN